MMTGKPQSECLRIENDSVCGCGTSSAELQSQQGWIKKIVAIEAINIILIVATAWILLCSIIYGTKTRRWTKKPSDSSLNNGVIFISCIVAVSLAIPRLVTTQVLCRIRDFNDSQCEVVGDISKAAFALSTYSVYIFLWLKQRLIYKHPYVKNRISKWVDMFSRGFGAIITVFLVAITCLYEIPDSYKNCDYGCIYDPNDEKSITSKANRGLILALSWVVLLVSVLLLSIYPAVRVQKKTRDELGLENSATPKKSCDRKRRSLWNSIMSNDSYVSTNPVQMSINRTMICSIIIAVTDVAAVIIDVAVISTCAPLAVGQVLYDISSLINVLCMLATFTFFGRIMTVCFPRVSRRRKIKHFTSTKNTDVVLEQEEPN